MKISKILQFIESYIDKGHNFFKNPRNQFITTIILLTAMITSFFTVTSIVNTVEIPISEREEEKGIERREIRVELTVEMPTGPQVYSERILNTDTIEEFFEKIRETYSFEYERISYRYGDEIDNVNGIKAPDGFDWKLFKNGKDVTYEIGKLDYQDYDKETSSLILKLVSQTQ